MVSKPLLMLEVCHFYLYVTFRKYSYFKLFHYYFSVITHIHIFFLPHYFLFILFIYLEP